MEFANFAREFRLFSDMSKIQKNAIVDGEKGILKGITIKLTFYILLAFLDEFK
jgi:hypothetical protein